LTSDNNPLDALYATSLAEATENDKPSVVFLGSYAHCPTDLCRASLSALKSIQPRYADRVNFLHFETHDLADPEQFSAAYQAWGLSTEPWFFFLDKKGRVLSRVEGGLDSTELDLLTRLTLGEQVTKPQP
jgi:cytochrome oxidase Cu insertion factor (SCO1/SenC/PrrC family)